MYGVVDIEYIRKKHFIEGWSIHRIADELHVCRQTVRRALNDPGPWKYVLKADKPCPVVFDTLEMQSLIIKKCRVR
jgi:DNA invertase Pin-like site-specific DNA recombinase